MTTFLSYLKVEGYYIDAMLNKNDTLLHMQNMVTAGSSTCPEVLIQYKRDIFFIWQYI